MKLIALYKAFSGGEWFERSLELVSSHVDGIVVMMAVKPWAGQGENDCEKPLARFMGRAKLDFPIIVERGAWSNQEGQYTDGLKVIRDRFGPDARVLIVDTDELWPHNELMQLRKAMEEDNGEHFFYRSGIHTYLKTVLYQVWPKEPVVVTVGLSKPEIPCVYERFQPREACAGLPSLELPEITFHHMAYVREDESKIAQKFGTTRSQEPNQWDDWMLRVWPNIPFGYDLHMTRGSESIWHQCKGLFMSMLPDELLEDPLVQASILKANKFWQNWIENQPPEKTLVPQPNNDEKAEYRCDLWPFYQDVDAWYSKMKTTVLESLVLANLAHRYSTDKLWTVEIGSGTGGSMIALAMGCKTSKLVSIDPFLPYDEENCTGLARNVTEGDWAQFANTICSFGFQDRVMNIKLMSDEAAGRIADGSCDLIFVDGNHTYEIVKMDLELYWPKIKSGGILIGHDYTTRFPGVIRAVKEWKHYPGITVPHGTSLFYIVKE